MITVQLKGGMGNQMFQYALGRALSLKYKVPLHLDLSFLLDQTPRLNFTFRNYDLDIFNIKVDNISKKEVPFYQRIFGGFLGRVIEYFKRFTPSKGIEKSFSFDSTILNIGPDAYLDGYWQSPKYFEDIEDIIREDFTFKKSHSLKINNLMELIKKEESLCIHVRRGDYVGNSFHDVVTPEYYKKAIEKIISLKKIDKIYVFSDDIKWCEENMSFELPTMFVGDEYAGEKAEGHLALMSACKNFIIPNSTFSWWGAWLAMNKEKVVIVPSQWFGIKSMKFDIIPEGWIKI